MITGCSARRRDFLGEVNIIMVECMHASVLGEHDLLKLTLDCVMK